ncbi:hypothetical protein L211DRAFT_890452 [Terfezia boudieri ATCC MYA-4762]|uniref:Uncharacterized protein n=1 Tax=Terfezia boudieri ATCC MYA-4762 TaxID=1051890 RepID=A0A3N4LE30_9PEZI|nr:hypothetical protein L211DRAFT_890452 [Terfezia boudieri ATCC MYA-4762]
MMPVNLPSHFGPYSNEVIDHSDPTIIEFHGTFGMMDEISRNTPTPDMSVPNLLDKPAPTTKQNTTQHVKPTIQQATSAVTELNTESNLDEIAVQFSLGMHAAILGITQEELTQFLATAPEVSEEEIDHILTNLPPLVENPQELQEHASGNQHNNTLEYHPTTSDTSTIDPRLLMLLGTHYNVPNAQPESAIHQQTVITLAPTVTVAKPELSPRALRALRRALLAAKSNLHK